MGSRLFFMAANMHQLACISEDPKFHNFLKDPSRLHAHCLQDTTDPKSPRLSLEWGKTKKHTPRQEFLPSREKLAGLLRPPVRITAKAHSEWKPLRWDLSPGAQSWPGPMGLSFPWPLWCKRHPLHFQPWRGPIWPGIEGIIFTGAFPDCRAMLLHFLGTVKTIQRTLKLLEENLHSFSVSWRYKSPHVFEI